MALCEDLLLHLFPVLGTDYERIISRPWLDRWVRPFRRLLQGPGPVPRRTIVRHLFGLDAPFRVQHGTRLVPKRLATSCHIVLEGRPCKFCADTVCLHTEPTNDARISSRTSVKLHALETGCFLQADLISQLPGAWQRWRFGSWYLMWCLCLAF